jgi:hypothetical protein
MPTLLNYPLPGSSIILLPLLLILTSLASLATSEPIGGSAANLAAANGLSDDEYMRIFQSLYLNVNFFLQNIHLGTNL